MNYIQNWLEKINSGRVGIIAVYFLSLGVIYFFLWSLIEPLAIPDSIAIGDTKGLVRPYVHILFSLLVSSHIVIILVIVAFKSPDKVKTLLMKIKLLETENNNTEFKFNALRDEVINLAKERDILRIGTQILHDHSLVDSEITSLFTLSVSMRKPSIEMPKDVALEIIAAGITIICADKNFRTVEESSIRKIAKDYGIEMEAEILINEVRIKYGNKS